MTHTPFPRTLSSATCSSQAKLAHRHRRSADQDLGFRIRNDLDRALPAYPLTARHVNVLSVLLSFLGDRTRVVFASNRTLCSRLHGLPVRTLSRQVKLLVEQGFVRRVMSPNGKRWARRTEDGDLEAFGLDLTPFFERAQEFAEKAAEVTRRKEQIEAARLRLSLLRQRLEDLGASAELVDEIRRERRRVPCPATLERLESQAREILIDLGQSVDNPTLPSSASEELACNDGHSGLHQQTRNDRVFSPERPLKPRNADCMVEEEAGNGAGDGVGSRPDPQSIGDASPHSLLTAVTGRTAPICLTPGLDRSGPPRHEPEPSDRGSLADYVQSVLSSFRSKLQAQTRTPRGERGAAETSGSSALGSSMPTGTPGSPAAPRYDVALTETPIDRPAQMRRVAPPLRSTLDAAALPSLESVIEACPESLSLLGERPRTWSELFEAAWRLGRCFQIADDTMAMACAKLGRDGLAVTLFGLCERHATIRRPAAYLRFLCLRPGFQPAELLRAGREVPYSR